MFSQPKKGRMTIIHLGSEKSSFAGDWYVRVSRRGTITFCVVQMLMLLYSSYWLSCFGSKWSALPSVTPSGCPWQLLLVTYSHLGLPQAFPFAPAGLNWNGRLLSLHLSMLAPGTNITCPAPVIVKNAKANFQFLFGPEDMEKTVLEMFKSCPCPLRSGRQTLEIYLKLSTSLTQWMFMWFFLNHQFLWQTLCFFPMWLLRRMLTEQRDKEQSVLGCCQFTSKSQHYFNIQADSSLQNSWNGTMKYTPDAWWHFPALIQFCF